MATQTLSQVFARGVRAEGRSGAPLVLAGRSSAWQVTEGHVDVFLVRLEGGLPADALHLLFRAATGDLLFGLGDDTLPPADWALVALGAPGHELRRLHRGALPTAPDAAEAELRLARQAWLSRLAAALPAKPGAELAADAPAFEGDDAAFDAAFEALAVALESMFTREQEGDGERLRDRVRMESAYLQRAVRHLASVLEPAVATASVGGTHASPVLVAFERIAGHLGFPVTVPPARSDGVVLTPADEVAALVEASRVRRRTVALKGEWWHNPVEPLLAWRQEDGAAVALLPGPRGYLLHAPGREAAEPLTAEIAQRLQPFAVTFYRSFSDLRLNLLEMMKFGSRGLLRDYVLVILMGVAVGLLGMVTPIATGALFDNVIPSGDRQQLGQLAAALLAGAFATAMFQFTQGFAMLRAEGRMDSTIQSAVWDRLLRLPAPFFRNYTAGDLAVRANGINAIRQALSGTTLHSLFSAVFSMFNLVLLFFYSVKLAFVAVGLVLVAVLFTVGTNFLILRQQRHLAGISGKLSGMVYQFLNSVGKLRATGSETRAFHQWAAQYASQQQHE
jgi:hypothetical protein